MGLVELVFIEKFSVQLWSRCIHRLYLLTSTAFTVNTYTHTIFSSKRDIFLILFCAFIINSRKNAVSAVYVFVNQFSHSYLKCKAETSYTHVILKMHNYALRLVSYSLCITTFGFTLFNDLTLYTTVPKLINVSITFPRHAFLTHWTIWIQLFYYFFGFWALVFRSSRLINFMDTLRSGLVFPLCTVKQLFFWLRFRSQITYFVRCFFSI